MNTPPRSPTQNLTEFQQVIREKSDNFVGREFVFAAITDFLHRYNRGYFTIVGEPCTSYPFIIPMTYLLPPANHPKH
ncbi:hypothetical protein [Iningainema tapete]|uniref:Uncharacterized protein n=1 Tax=Iningainema tapete BLCC-T55 TaxID=2748662 RepID=A0A8J7BXI8_9CYAN|nr:hypothetical protein [Iningainema tapete BLCC-T55]